ncbi:MAG TPA: DNA polymerase IV [Acidimicrobiia bacterium]
MAGADILHVDLDAFYASIEQLREPRLRGRPIAVGGGVVLAASYEARAFGVQAGMPGRLARELCPGLVFVRGSFDRYGLISKQVFAICEDFSPLIEQVSIDEAFIDVSGAHGLFGSAADIAAAIRSRVRIEVGLPISAGVARTKFLAKVASQVAKPDGLVVVEPDRELEFLHPLSVRLLWGVGRVTAAKLASMGVHTVGELAGVDPRFLERMVGRAAGAQLSRLTWNIDRRAVTRERTAGSVGAQSAFGSMQDTRDARGRVLLMLASRIGSRLRKSSRAGRTITVRVRFEDFSAVTRSATLAAPVASDAAILQVAEGLADTAVSAAAAGRRVNLLGIAVSKLTGRGALQLELPLGWGRVDMTASGSAEAELQAQLEEALDAVRIRYGKSAVGPMSLLLGRPAGYAPDAFRELAEKS